MAKKKIGVVTIAVIAIAAIIGLGSISAILHGREKEEHVHTYKKTVYTQDPDVYSNPKSFNMYSNVCSECGEKMEVINAAEVKLGYDLTGYKIRYVESKKAALASQVTKTSEGIYVLGDDIDLTGIIGFNQEPWYWDAVELSIKIVGNSFAINKGASSIKIADFDLLTGNTAEGLPAIFEHDPIEDGKVGYVGDTNGAEGGNGVLGEIFGYFEFYYE